MARARGARDRLCRQALELAGQVPVDRLHARALEAIAARPADERIAIACSGGADSVALLLLLWAHRPERRKRWLVLHFNHRLRGRAADADARFVQRLAAGLGERCVVGTWRRGRGEPKTAVSEAAAREARWKFFTSAMRRGGARVIALGHQLDDVAETMLMRLARGSGTAGLAAPRPVQVMSDGQTRVRPLLRIPVEALRTALQVAGVRWREDASNAGDDYLRNRIRHHVLPALTRAAGRDVRFAIGESRALLEEDALALEAFTDALPPVQPDRPTEVRALAGQPAAIVRRFVHRWAAAARLGEPLGRAMAEVLVRALANGTECRLSAGADQFIVVEQGVLRLDPTESLRPPAAPWPEVRLKVGGSVTGPRGDRLSLRRVRLTVRLVEAIRSGVFPPDETAFVDPGAGWAGWFGVRGWLPGDRYRPLGAPGRRKLQDLFVDRRVPRELRPLLPVVVDAHGRVIWVPGFPPADEVAVQPTGKHVVQLTYLAVPPIVHRSTDQSDARP